jgi:branched-chain amino acid transport system ATP-binding protein
MRRNFLWQAIYFGRLTGELAYRAYVERIIDFLEIRRSARRHRAPALWAAKASSSVALAWSRNCCCRRADGGMNVEKGGHVPRLLDVNDEFGTTIALIEHDMAVVMDISDRVVVLDYGRKIAAAPEGAPPDAVAAYLGEER